MGDCEIDALECLTGCLDIFGVCPADVTGCYYYCPKVKATTSTGLSAGEIVAIVGGAAVGFIILVILLFTCSRPRSGPQRSRNLNQPNQITTTTMNAQSTSTPILIPPRPAMTQMFTAMPTPSTVPPPYYNGQLYNVPEPYYG